MPSKLKKAIGAVKDQTSISLAKVSNNGASNLEVIILKATSHDEVPLEERYVDEILQLVASNKVYAATCAHTIAKRIGRTRNWVVALKCLMLILRIFQDGDPYFPREVLHMSKRGGKILNLSGFRDNSNSSPWDYTAYVRTFALYLDERLDCFLMGKLQRRRRRESSRFGSRRMNEPIIQNMKPGMLLDRITYWQRLLDRAIATKPTGAAKTNNLVQISLHAIIQESFDLYRDISDGLALLLDSFFQLQYQTCASAFQTSIKASKQFEELSSYYALCKTMGVGRSSEYPSVQKISEELLETLREFLKDQSSFPATARASPQALPPVPPSAMDSMSDHMSSYEFSEASEPAEGFFSENVSEYSSRCTSLEDLMSGGTSPSILSEQENQTDQLEKQRDLISGETSPSLMSEQGHQSEQSEKQQDQEDSISTENGGNSVRSGSTSHGTGSTMNFVSFDDWPQQEQEASNPYQGDDLFGPVQEIDVSRECWEMELAVAATQVQSDSTSSNELAIVAFDPFGNAPTPCPQTNPFLDDDTASFGSTKLAPTVATTTSQPFAPSIDRFSVAPTFQATPTFSAKNPNDYAARTQINNDPFASSFDDPFASSFNDPFASSFDVSAGGQKLDASTNPQHLQYEQQLWLQNQSKIMAKHLT